MSERVVILGAGFGGLELSTILSEEFGEEIDVALIDSSEAFVFGFSKLDVMFGRTTPDAVRFPYSRFSKPGVRVLRETVTAIDPGSRTVTTDAGTHEADILVVALGAAYDFDAVPGLADATEFYTEEGADRLAPLVAEFSGGDALIAVCGAPFKCPPAPSECALMLDTALRERGVRDACRITYTIPLPSPVPPSPEASAALTAAFAERDIAFMPGKRVSSVDPSRGSAALDDGSELPFDLLLGVPVHRAPDVVIESGMTEDGYVSVDPATLATRFEGVYAIGDVATAGVPKAGVFAEGAARALGQSLIAQLRAGGEPGRHTGQGSCYIEFGGDRVGRVDIDFLSGPEKTGVFFAPSAELRAAKDEFGSSRRARWFGL